MHKWSLATLHAEIPAIVRRWEKWLGVKVTGYFLQRMKTKWGSCNPEKRTIRLNTELVKKPKDLLEYVVVHEMLHILEPRHSERFIGLCRYVQFSETPSLISLDGEERCFQ